MAKGNGVCFDFFDSVAGASTSKLYPATSGKNADLVATKQIESLTNEGLKPTWVSVVAWVYKGGVITNRIRVK